MPTRIYNKKSPQSRRTQNAKTIVFLLLVTLLLVSACMGNNHDVSIEYVDTDQTTGKVRQWLEENGESNGLYLRKVTDESKIYLYINYSNEEEGLKYTVSTVNIQAEGQKLTIRAVPISNENKTFEKVFVINKMFREIDLNQTTISISEIFEL